MSLMGVEVKKEPAEIDTEQRILTLLKDNPKGLSTTEICRYFQEKSETTVGILNQLLVQQRITLFKKASGEDFVKLSVPSSVSQVQGVDDDEKLVLQLIEEVGNKGIWRHEISYKSKIVEVKLNKILKTLTTKKLIKPIQSVSAGKKKMFILADLEPDPCVTGGNFYSGQQFDSEYFNMLHAMCYKYLSDKAEEVKKLSLDPVEQRMRMFLSSLEVHAFVQNSRVSKVELKVQEIDDILQTLVFDGKAELMVRTSSVGVQTNYYSVLSPLIEVTGVMRTPCGHCPLLHECKEGGVISPSTCEYMKTWLAF